MKSIWSIVPTCPILGTYFLHEFFVHVVQINYKITKNYEKLSHLFFNPTPTVYKILGYNYRFISVYLSRIILFIAPSFLKILYIGEVEFKEWVWIFSELLLNFFYLYTQYMHEKLM
jgi:hypothetical protein